MHQGVGGIELPVGVAVVEELNVTVGQARFVARVVAVLRRIAEQRAARAVVGRYAVAIHGTVLVVVAAVLADLVDHYHGHGDFGAVAHAAVAYARHIAQQAIGGQPVDHHVEKHHGLLARIETQHEVTPRPVEWKGTARGVVGHRAGPRIGGQSGGLGHVAHGGG